MKEDFFDKYMDAITDIMMSPLSIWDLIPAHSFWIILRAIFLLPATLATIFAMILSFPFFILGIFGMMIFQQY